MSKQIYDSSPPVRTSIQKSKTVIINLFVLFKSQPWICIKLRDSNTASLTWNTDYAGIINYFIIRFVFYSSFCILLNFTWFDVFNTSEKKELTMNITQSWVKGASTAINKLTKRGWDIVIKILYHGCRKTTSTTTNPSSWIKTLISKETKVLKTCPTMTAPFTCSRCLINSCNCIILLYQAPLWACFVTRINVSSGLRSQPASMRDPLV